MAATPNPTLDALTKEYDDLTAKREAVQGNSADKNRVTTSQGLTARIDELGRQITGERLKQNEASMVAPGPMPTATPSLLSQYTGATMPDAEKIRQQEIERQNLAAQTQALNTLYDEQLSRERQKFAGYSGQQRALAARGGILSTPRDEAQQMELADKQRQVEGAINAERATKIAELTDRVNQRAEERVKAERDFATTQRDKYLATLKESQALARQDLNAFAQGGGSLTDLTTEQYQKLLKDTGMDDFALKATFNINNPKSKAQFTSVGDKLVGYYINPKTGQFETFESAPIPGISGGKYSLKETTKGLLAIPENLDPTKSLDEQIKVYDSGTDFTDKGKLTGAPAEYEYYKQQEEAAGRTPMSFNDYQTADANRKARAERAGDILTTKDILKGQTDLRKEFNALPVVKNFNDIKSSYNRVNTAFSEAVAQNKNKKSKAAADQVLIVSFNKLIDPGSVVREGEYARSTEGQSILARLKGAAEKALQGGTGLTDGDRKQIVEVTKKLYADYEKMYNDLATEYRGYASDYGADPDKIAKQAGKQVIQPDQVDWANI